jgi:N-acetylglucosaminyldiphosphoundecaprenol N-acetyl-beta-D-mannosaminyltransferase
MSGSTPHFADRPGTRQAVRVGNWPINIKNMPELLRSIFDRLRDEQSSFLICTLNLDHLVQLRRNEEFRDAYRKAEFVSADGFPIVSLAKTVGFEAERTTGADLISPLCEHAVQHGIPLFFVGTSLDALCKSAARLHAQYPSLDIRGVYSPPRPFDPYSETADEIINLLSESGARICFVALGAPRQEIFSARAAEKTQGVCFLPVGAALDFIAGTQQRSPRILQRCKLEWAWRLVLSPRSMFLRYFRCAVLFVRLLVEQHLFGVRGRRLQS